MSVLEYIDSDIFTPVYQNKLPIVRSKHIDAICRELYYAISAKETIMIYGDYDMDGFCCCKVWDEVLTSLYDVTPVLFKYTQRTHNIDRDLLRQAKDSGARIVIICDTGSSSIDHDVVSLLHSQGRLPIVIDHHNWEGNYDSACVYNLIFNSHEERELLGGAEISGAYASLLVCQHLCEKYFKHSLSYNAMVYALASMYSDVVDLSTPAGRALYNMVSTIKMPGPNFINAFNKWDYAVCRRLFSFLVAPKVNACFRTENFAPLNRALEVRNKYDMVDVVDGICNVHQESTKLVDMLTPLFKRERFGGIVFCLHEVTSETRAMHVRNFSGLIATKIANEEKAIAITAIKDGRVYEGSFRDYYSRSLLDTLKLFCKADGHDAAFGISFTNISDFKRHLKGLSTVVERSIRKDYNVLSSTLVSNDVDIQTLALYNEYMNVQPRVLLVHRCSYARLLRASKYRRFYDVGLPYNISSTVPLLDGANILLEPTISKSVELRCVE